MSLATTARHRRPAVLSLITVMATVMGMLIAVPVAAADPPPATTSVTLTTTTENGFTHPGIGVSPASLETAKAQVAAGVEPWKSYYAAMAETSYASRTLAPANQGAGDGVPAYNAFNSTFVQSKFIPDALGAYTQALMYYFTGDTVYRQNALKIIRIWSHMDPAQYTHYADAHIHAGIPMYNITAAAELIRATSSPDSLDGYPLTWTAQDTTDLTNNLIVPGTETWFHDNSYYMNQQTFPLLGAMAGYIFTNNRARYDEGVEWFTVNSTAPNPNINGALSSMFRLISASDPLNKTGKSFVQHLEMGRDQAHSGGDVRVLTTLARVVDVQGTKVDSVKGTPSNSSKAVNVYKFLGNRLLAGGEVYTKFMMGRDTPWIDVTGGAGRISQWYRGRWFDSVNELYWIYQFKQGVNVASTAPAIYRQFQQRDGAFFYSDGNAEAGTALSDGRRSFWGGTDPGAEFWLSLPSAAAGTVPPVPTNSDITFASKSTSLDSKSWRVTENGTTFLRAIAAPSGASVAVRSMVYTSRSGYTPIGVLVRTSDVATLSISRTSTDAPYAQVTIPNTGGQWRYVTYDMDSSKIPDAAMGANNIVFYRLTGKSGAVDLQSIKWNVGSSLTPPRFAAGNQLTLIGVAGSPLTATVDATDAGGETLRYSLQRAPKGVAINADNGALTWTPTTKQTGDSTFWVQTDDGQTGAGVAVTVRVAANRAGAIALASTGYDGGKTYTGSTKAAYDQASSAASALVSTGSATDFASALKALQEAVAALRLLNPTYADGTLAWGDISTSSVGAGVVPNLVDDDPNTFSGDLSVRTIDVDFGAGFRVKADSFQVQARLGFGNRSQGAAVYGSIDGVQWTKLTSAETTNTDARETLTVDQALRDQGYRFFRLQVDHPGAASDPNFPGIFSISEFRVSGTRSEAVTAISSASLSSSNTLPGRAVNGDTVTLTFTSSSPISALQASIEGVPATLTGSDTSFTATATLPATVGSARPVAFRVDYKLSDGRQADPLVVTTDGSKLYLSNESTMITDVTSKFRVVTAGGDVDSGKAASVAKMFDGQTSTFSDIGPVAGFYYAILDAGDGGAIALSRADLLARQDQFGLSRTNTVHFEGSNDLTTWTRISPNAAGTLDWQNLAGTASNKTFRYLKLAGNTWINLAELRLFGTFTAPPASYVSTATIGSSNAISNLAVAGDTVTVTLTGSEAIQVTTATIDGRPATVSGSGTNWTASAVIPADATPFRRPAFRVDYATATGKPGQALVSTTDGSGVYLSTTTDLITGVTAKATVIDGSGNADTTKSGQVAKMFDGSITTYSDIGAVDGKYFATLDLGEGGSIRLTGADLQARRDTVGVARAAGLQLQGSNDLSAWTTLTGAATSTAQWQSWPVPANTNAYRYLRVLSNDWINVAELRLFGQYTAPPAQLITTATLRSSNSLPGLAVAGDTVTAQLTGSEALQDVVATIGGVPATVSGSGTSFTASVVVPADAVRGSMLSLRVTASAAASGTASQPLTRTTDGSSVFISTTQRLLGDLSAVATQVGTTGAAESSKQSQVVKIFDGKTNTFSDIGAVNGAYYAIFDLGQSRTWTVSNAELLVRQDSVGTTRAGSLHLEGSNDLSKWTSITANAKGTLAWQALTPTAAANTGYRYIRIANNNWINIAELRLFGTQTG